MLKPRWRTGWFVGGCLISRIGDEMAVSALLLFGSAVSGSSRTPGLAYAGLTAAAALGGPLLGLVLDRSRRPGRTLAGCLAAYATGLAIITMTGAGLSLPALITIATVTGLFAPALAGGWSSRFVSVIADRGRAGSLDVASYNVAGMAGPALAGLTAMTLGASVALAFAAAMVALAMPAALTLTGPPPKTVSGERGLVDALLTDLRRGFQPLVKLPALRAATLGSSVSFIGIGMLVVACPHLGATRLGDLQRGAWLITALAASSLLATALTTRWPPRTSPDLTFLVSTAVAGVGMILTALAAGPVETILAVAVVGLADGPQLAAIFAIRHREAPCQYVSQVFATAASTKIGCGALGGALAGLLIDTSATAALSAAAGVQALAVIVAIVSGTPVPAEQTRRRPGRCAVATLSTRSTPRKRQS